MTEADMKTAADFILPPSVVSRIDVSKLVSEAEKIDNAVTAALVRSKAGAPAVAQPVLSEQFISFLQLNKLDLNNGPARSELVKQLRKLKDAAPVIHMTFAVEADRESLQYIVAWLRSSVHRQAVVEVGLQPALVAGVYLRTPNHVHDLSLRNMLAKSHGVLTKELEALRVGK